VEPLQRQDRTQSTRLHHQVRLLLPGLGLRTLSIWLLLVVAAALVVHLLVVAEQEA
jgi:hypothetical protein